MIHLAFFLYYFAQKNLQKAILFGGNTIKLRFLLFSTRSPSCLWRLNSQSTIVLAWIVSTFFSLKKAKNKIPALDYEEPYGFYNSCNGNKH